MSFSIIQDFYKRPPDHPSQNTFRMLNAMEPFFDSGCGGSFLDIACHDGEKTTALMRRISADLTVGVDFEGAALARAHRRGIAAVAVDLNQKASLPFPEASFDCIHAGEIIEHLFSPDALLREIHRLLKPSGYAVITTPNLASWRNRIALLLGWQPFGTEVSTEFHVGNPRAYRGVLPGHIRVFTARALRELAGKYGLAVDRTAGIHSGVPNSLLTRITAAIDILVHSLSSSLSDTTLIRVSRTGRPDGEGAAGRS
jgi:SAM-dependent methyltransferase